MTTGRLPRGGTGIDREHRLAWTFDGQALSAFVGDTIASGLLAAGIRVVGRSIYHNRPRGAVSAGPEEPNALVQVTWASGTSEPMVNAATAPLEAGLVVRSLTGLGRLETDDDGARFDARHAHVEVLVIGAGASGRAAAARARAADAAARVLLIDRDPAATGDDVLSDTTALGFYDHGLVTAVQRRPTPGTEGRLWRIRAERIVLATGATERPIIVADGDRPGVMLASAAATYVRRYGVRPGSRAVIFTNNDTTRDVEAALAEAAIEVVAVVDARRGEQVLGTDGDADGVLTAIDTSLGRVDADLLLLSGGWNPNVALWSHARGSLRYEDAIGAFVPDQPPPTLSMTAVGAAAGEIEGLGAIEPAWLVPPADGDGSHHYLDPGRDATLADLERSLGAGLVSIEHVKRYTTIGTGIEQGRTGGVVASAITASLLGHDVGAVGVPTFRPPLVPVSFAEVAGRDRGPVLADPIRVTAIHDRHVAAGAVFEDVGQWKRPRYVPIDGETMDEAVLRECAAARSTVATMDASTLGKIDIQGPDAGIFLDRIYTNMFSTLKVGACRYGLMCKPDGMVFDDGVTTRLADDRFHMTTTTGNAAPVLDHLEEWLQTEWPDLRVRCTSVTEQWSTIAVVGPRSREVVAAVAPGLDVASDAFPFMTWRDAVIAGAPGRVFRISFSGELAYELNVPTPHGATVWDAVLSAGNDLGLPVTPYGTEAMHVLRAEKGYPIIGQETDGTVTPQDLGMAALCSTRKAWIGQRSHRRPDALRPDRKHLVGLLPVDPTTLLPEGAQLVAPDADLASRPVAMLGHVTSSYRSAALGRTFALAMVKAGRDRLGERLLAPLLDGSIVEVEVTGPVLFDVENRRRDGDPEAVA